MVKGKSGANEDDEQACVKRNHSEGIDLQQVGKIG